MWVTVGYILSLFNFVTVVVICTKPLYIVAILFDLFRIETISTIYIFNDILRMVTLLNSSQNV